MISLETLALARNLSSGGGLPEVTPSDNGDVLTVVDGVWGKAAPSGGGLLVTCTITEDEQTGDVTMTLDKNYTEIVSAVESGIMPVIIGEYSDEDGGGVLVMRLQNYAVYEGSTQGVPDGYTWVVTADGYRFMSDSATGTLVYEGEQPK